MSGSNEENSTNEIPIAGDVRAFAADEMIACGKCSRKSPPTRLKCVYCGTDLEIPVDFKDKIRPALRKLEAWEKGFNLIMLPGGRPDPAEFAKLFKLEPEPAQRIIEAGSAVPVARAESERECGILKTSLEKLGAESVIVPDTALAPDVQPKRLRGITFNDGSLSLSLFNDESTVEIPLAELRAIVTGAVFSKEVQATEKRKKGETKMLDATETASDEPVFDLYTSGEPLGYRVTTAGFDFSCLGEKKGILARENMRRLIEELARFAPDAKLIDDYISLRAALGEVWEIDVRRDSLGLQRSSFGKFDLSSLSSSSNLRQFNRYSRLQNQLIPD